MKITANQAAEILGISNSSVYTLIKEGKLKNHAENGDAKRGHKKLDMKEVKEFKKEFVPKGNAVSKRMPKVPQVTGGPSIFAERLDRIEKKLDLLIGMWQ
jgi:excisionase family DNA binding protein